MNKEKIILIAFGSFLGACAAFCFYLAWPWLQVKLAPGKNFETVADLQASMLKEDTPATTNSEVSVDLRALVQPHPKMEIMYDMRPDLSVKFQRQPVRTNSCGMRGPERSIAKADGLYRIALLGDSFTFGWGVAEEEIFASVLERTLQGYLGDSLQIEVLNFGVPGYSTFQEVAAFEEKGLDFQPDLVLVYIVDNDFGLPFFIRDTASLGKMMTAPAFTQRASKGETSEQYAERRKLENLINPSRWLMHLLELGKKHHFPVYVTINPRESWRKDYNKLWALHGNRGFHFLSIREPIMKLIEERQIDIKSLSLPADPHPSAVKHQLLGELLANGLYPEIRKSAGEYS